MASVIGYIYEAGYEAGLRGEDCQEPLDCRCRDSWMLGYQRGAATRRLREKHSK